MMMNIQLCESDAQILACFATLVQLRPHLERETLVEQVRRQQQQGFQLVSGTTTTEQQTIVAVAGFGIYESLSWGKYMYVHDLVVDAQVRSQHYGQAMFDWLVTYAQQQHCTQFHLDSGVQRFDAHRFYLRNRMQISSHHFAFVLPENP